MTIVPDFSSVPLTIEPTYKEMMSITEEDGVPVVRLNYSSFDIMQTCWRKVQYELVDNWRPKSSHPATIFGTALHAALEEFYSGEIKDRFLPGDWIEEIDEMAYGQSLPHENDFLIYRATRKFIEAAAPLSQLPDTDKRSIPNGAWILRHYFEIFVNDPYVILRDTHGPLVERKLTARLYDGVDLKIDFHGTIDCVLENSLTKSILITDHKTSSVVGAQFYNRLKPNHQYTGYLWLAQQCLNIKTDKFMVNCLQVKSRPKTSRGTPPHFPRQITTRDAGDIEEFKKAVVTFVKQFIRMNRGKNFPLGSVNACSMYGSCKFLEVCSSPASIRENILGANYVKVN